jgi:nitrile hydratase subunit alpha
MMAPSMPKPQINRCAGHPTRRATFRLLQALDTIQGTDDTAQPHRRGVRRNEGNGTRRTMADDRHDHDHHDRHSGSTLTEPELRVRALETILTEKGYIDPAALDAIIEAYETRIGPHNGAKAVAKAWVNPAFKQALLTDATKAIASLGIMSRVGDHLVAVENTERVHNMIVCTLCSCYPWEVLGLPPVWYKSAPYRSRTVIDPRGVLADFGVTLPATTDIRVWDSTAETRFIVLPLRPAGSEGLREDELATLVTRNSMIGTGLALPPGTSTR